MTSGQGLSLRIIAAVERLARRYELGAILLDETSEALLRVGLGREIYELVDPLTDDLLEVGDAAAACFPENPLLEAAIRFGVADIAVRVRNEKRNRQRQFHLDATGTVAGDPGSGSASFELTELDALVAELDDAAEDACGRALERATGSEAAVFANLLTANRPERLIREASGEFPPAPDSQVDGPEMQLGMSLISALTLAGSFDQAIAETRALPTVVQQLAAAARIVRTYYSDQTSVELLPAVVADFFADVDWSGAFDQLDVVASYLLRAHPQAALDLLKRWRSGPHAAEGGKDQNIYGASMIALAAGDEELALRIARHDAGAPLRNAGAADGCGHHELPDFVIGALSPDPLERVEHLLRSSRPGSRDFHERRYVDASRILMEVGELTPAACLFWLQAAGAATGHRTWGPFESLDPALYPGLGPSFEEKLALLKDLQRAGVPGTRRFDRIRFRNPVAPGSIGRTEIIEYLPRSLSALRAGCADYELWPPEIRSYSGRAR